MNLLFLRYKNARLNDEQRKQLSDYASNLSLFFLGTVIVPVFGEVDKVNYFMLVLEVASTITFLVFSMLLLKGTNYES